MNKLMKFRKIKLIAIGIISLFTIVFAWYLFDRFSYANKQSYYQVNTINQDTVLTIGIIGDSWVARQKLDDFLHKELLKNGFDNRIISSGHPSAKSKLIYQNIFKNNSDKYSSRFIIENKPDYCIVIAGVNDSCAQIGKKYYAHNMILIIEALLHYGVKPIVVSLPEFDVLKAIDNINILFKTRNIISAKINNNGEMDNISTYKEFLKSELSRQNLINKIVYIDFDKVCADYSNCKVLYADPFHLSRHGNKKLCEIIVLELKEKYNALQQ